MTASAIEAISTEREMGEKHMKIVAAFEGCDIAADRFVRSNRLATIEAIQRIGARPERACTL